MCTLFPHYAESFLDVPYLQIYEFDVQKKEYSDWCRKVCNNFPNVWMKRHQKIFCICTSPNYPDKIFFSDLDKFFILDKTQVKALWFFFFLRRL